MSNLNISKKYFFIFFVIQLLVSNSFGQLTADKTSHDFGDINTNTNRTVEFKIVNHYNFSIIMSSFAFDLELSSTYTPVTLKPGDTLCYRVKIIPRKTGAFKKTIPISFYHLSDTIKFDITANILTTQFTDKSPVAPFEEKAARGEEPYKRYPILFEILDEQTGRPIPNASVTFSAKTIGYKSSKTDSKGVLQHELINRYEASIYAYGYRSKKVQFSVGCNDSTRIIYLTKSNPGDKTESDYLSEYEAAHPIVADEDYLFFEKDNDEVELLKPLENDKYKPNNIVFLLDVSISMLDHNRIDLLKTAMIQLISLMRPIDNLSIITFSENTTILFEPTFLTESNRNLIITKIDALKPGGMTNGGKGLKLAFKLIQEKFDATKNNQVLLATDGALGAYMKHEDIVSLVEQNAQYTKTSVVTLSGYNWSRFFMSEIARAGNGRLISINSLDDAKLMLVKDIKNNSILSSEE